MCLVASIALSQRIEVLTPILISMDYILSTSLPKGSKPPVLYNAESKPSPLPAIGSQLVWLLSTDFAESAQDPILTSTPSGQPRKNSGNELLTFLSNQSVKQSIVFYESRYPKKISSLDFDKIRKRFGRFSLFFDKDNKLSEGLREGTYQSQGGLYFLKDGIVVCSYLEVEQGALEKIALKFSKSGDISSCPINLALGQKVNELKPSNLMMTLQGTEHLYNLSDFKIKRTTNTDGSQTLDYGGNTQASSRFILEKIDQLAKKYKVKPMARVVKPEGIEKLKSLFPNWDFIPFYGNNKEVLWSNLGGSVAVVNSKKEVIANLLVFAGLEQSGNATGLEIALREARR